MNKKIKVLAMTVDKGACNAYRISQPYNNLAYKNNVNSESKFEFKYLQAQSDKGISYEIFDNFDVIVLQRVIDEGSLSILKYCKEKRKVVIHEIDDNLFTISPSNPFFHTTKDINYRKHFREALLMSDYIHTTTPEIADVYSQEVGVNRDNIYVFPNAIDLSHPRLSKNMSRRKELPKDKVVFGFQGGSSHKHDLRELPPIFPILDECPNSIFAFCSDLDSYRHLFVNIPLKYRNRIVYIQPEVGDFNRFPNLPSMFDIALAPLQDTVFNQGKSCLKLLESGVWQNPVVCSSIPDYERFYQISDGANPIVKKNKPKVWTDHIISLIESKSLRERLGNKARKAIDDYYNIQNINNMRMDFYNKLLQEKF